MNALQGAVNGTERAFYGTCRAGCGTPLTPQQEQRRARYCSDRCRLLAWAGRQARLDFSPPPPAPPAPVLRAAAPPHAPELQPALKRAAVKILALLQDGRAHSRHELEAIGGNRYCARLAEIRAFVWPAVVLGPRPQPSRGVTETEPMREGVEAYRLMGRA